MRNLKKLTVLLAAIFAFSVVGVASASAESKFTASAEGELAGHALENQVFKTNGGSIICEEVHISGTTNLVTSETHETWVYTKCNAFGFPVDIESATYTFTANKKVHFKKTRRFTVTGGIFGECTITVPEGQEVGTVSYDNNGGKLKYTPNITGISYTSSGGICGSSGTNGTYTGASEVERVGGGAISWDE